MITEFKPNKMYAYNPLHGKTSSVLFMTYTEKVGNIKTIVCKDIKNHDIGILLQGWKPDVVFSKTQYEYITDVTEKYPEYLI